MPHFNPDDYETVDSRIKRFYADHNDGRIVTQLLTDPNNLSVPVVRAEIWIGEILKASGLAFEKIGEGPVNRTSHLENCETSAIGRGLANAGYSGDKRPSREEMAKTTAEHSTKWEAMYDDLTRTLKKNLSGDKLGDALKWLDGFAKTETGMNAAKRKVDERFAESRGKEELQEKIANIAGDEQGEIF